MGAAAAMKSRVFGAAMKQLDYPVSWPGGYCWVRPEDLSFTEGAPTNESKVTAIMRRIKRSTPTAPIVADRGGSVTDGHHRLEAAMRLGLSRIAVRGSRHPLAIDEDGEE